MWSAASDAQWLTVVQGTQGSGAGGIRVRALANSGPSRQATISVGGVRVTVSQSAVGSPPPTPSPAPSPTPAPTPTPTPTPAPAPEPPPSSPPPVSCTYSLTPADATVTAAGGSGTATLRTEDACAWTASTNAAWLTLTSPATAPGPRPWDGRPPEHDPQPRFGPRDRLRADADHHRGGGLLLRVHAVADRRLPVGGRRHVHVRRAHRRDVHVDRHVERVVDHRHERSSGTGAGTVQLLVEPNATVSERTGTVRAGGRDFVVRQDALVGSVTIAGDMTEFSGTCPDVRFTIDGQVVHANGLTVYMRGSCSKLKDGKHLWVVGLPRGDGGLDATEVTFDADLLP